MTTAAATQSAPLVDSYARGATDVPLIEQTIGAFFADMVARQPDREALVSVHQGRRYTYAQLQTEAHRLASALLGLGLRKGDRVAVLAYNCVEWAEIYAAAAHFHFRAPGPALKTIEAMASKTCSGTSLPSVWMASASRARRLASMRRSLSRTCVDTSVSVVIAVPSRAAG